MSIEEPLQARTPLSVSRRVSPRRSLASLGLFAVVGGCAWRALVFGSLTLLAVFALVAVPLFAALLWIKGADPGTSSLMLQQRFAGVEIDNRWVPLEAISPHLISAVLMSEDARFCSHGGVDYRELEEAFDRAQERDDGQVRGASTISMQVIKNLFLWPGKQLSRKALEIAITPAMERMWSKRRILEVYLNIAEWGPGIFGAEAAARYHFGKSAARLTAREAALLAVSLPAPLRRQARDPGPGLNRLADVIQRRMRAASAYTRCIGVQGYGQARKLRL